MPIILGIDPGSKCTGYGLVSREGSRLRYVAAGHVTTRANAPLAARLHQVFECLQDIISQYAPDEVAVEDIFFAKNVRSAIRLGHVRGVALLAAAAAGLPVFEYPPASIKMAVAGYGRAEKHQVGLMVKSILNLDHNPQEDAADALAAAICHCNQPPELKGGGK